MAITISGENNNDRILAQDGVIDEISGINIVGLLTAGHINVGDNIQLGNAGVATATTFIGNLTGNVNATSNLLLQIGGSEKVRINSSGNLGIGNNSPNDKLVVNGAITSLGNNVPTYAARLKANYDSTHVLSLESYHNNNTPFEVIGSHADSGGANPRVVIAKDGKKVGIGSVSPAHALDIQGSSSSFTKLSLSNQTMNTSKYEIIFGDQGQVNHVVAANREITFATNGSSNERLRITSSGAVGINTTVTAATKLQVQSDGTSTTAGGNIVARFQSNGSGRDATIQLSDNVANSATISMLSSAFIFKQSGTERLRIESDGKIGMGDRSTSASNTCDPDGNQLLIRGASTFQTAKGHIMLTGDGATNGQGPQIVFSESGSGSNNAGAYIGHVRQGSNSIGDLVFGTRAISGDANTVPTERLRIRSDGEIVINHTQASTPLNNTFISIYDANSDSSAIDASGVSKNYAMISLHNYGTGIQGDTTGIGFGAGSAFSYTKGSIAFQRTGSYGLGDLVFLTNNDSDTTMVNEGDERMRITKEGDIYGPGGGRKNWFDNGSFDCRGGRRNATSMDYGNHHAYGWVTDRFMSRNSVQWTRSTNVPTGKGFSYSTQTNGAGGQIMQAVELPDYGDMGVFTPGSYWCVSIWSTVGMNHSGSAFSYDLGSTRTDVTGVGSGSYATTGETAAGTSTGTFNRYYRVYGPMPSSIISGATGLYFQWGFTGAGYSTGWQLERVPTSTSKPTPYEHVHPAVTTARCRRYCWQNVNSRLHNGYKRHDSNIHWQERFPVPPTHMPSGSNQSATPYGIHLHDGGLLTNFQSILQNPGVNSVSISEFDYRSGRFIIVGSTSYSPTHTTVPSWESQEYEINHGFF